MQVSPEKLSQADVSVSRLVQSVGQFIIVFPQSFVANVGCGLSVSESLHLAPASWFPLGCFAAQVSVSHSLCCVYAILYAGGIKMDSLKVIGHVFLLFTFLRFYSIIETIHKNNNFSNYSY